MHWSGHPNFYEVVVKLLRILFCGLLSLGSSNELNPIFCLRPRRIISMLIWMLMFMLAQRKLTTKKLANKNEQLQRVTIPLLRRPVQVLIVSQNNGLWQWQHLFAIKFLLFPIQAFVLSMIVSLFYCSLPIVCLNFLTVSSNLTSCQLFHSYIPILLVSFFSSFF